MPRHLTPDDSFDEPLGPNIDVPIITPQNREPIARVLTDPAEAWRSETTARKLANASLRGIPLPADADPDEIDRALERVMGDDDIVTTPWLRQGQRAAETVALVRQPLPATGFLVSEWLLLTNHHVLRTPETAAESEAFFRYEDTDDGGVSPVKVLFDPGRCFLTGTDTEHGLDFTLVALQPLRDGTAPGATFGWLPLIGTTGKVLRGEPLNIIQHPQGLTRRVAIRNNALLSLTDPIHLIYQTDTDSGSSGSPVLNDRWQLVALHQRSEPARNADGVAIDALGRPVTSETPEHLREWVANVGIRISCVVSHLRGLQLNARQRELVNEAIQ